METLKSIWAVIRDELSVNVRQGDATAGKLRQMLRRCPICSGDFSGHSYALFATEVFGESNKNRIELFFRVLEEHNWQEASTFRDWDPCRNDAEAYALKCITEEAALLISYSPFELYENDCLISVEVLSGSVGTELISFVPSDRWKALAPEAGERSLTP